MTDIRNFSIVAHIDHGKSTLADRFLEITGTVDKRQMKEQLLDSMELERERGITIKLAPVRMEYTPKDERRKTNIEIRDNFEIRNSHLLTEGKQFEIAGSKFILNLIDTPGHVDFNYEVSRSLAAVEGAILLVDAAQGVQAQTIGNLYLALEQNLTIIPAVNKIDLPAAQPEKTARELEKLLGCARQDILFVSGKTGAGVKELLEAVIERVPAPQSRQPQTTRALIFDSVYDGYRGVVAYVRMMDGAIKTSDKILLLGTQNKSQALEVGFFRPKYQAATVLQAGEIGYIVTGLKNIAGAKVGDTITLDRPEAAATLPLPGYREVKPMVFAGLFCREGSDYERLREAILKLKLNDAALTFEPEHSGALGFGFRCGFLGLLHLDIFQERLRREYNLDLIVTAPSVAYRITKTDGSIQIIKSPTELPDLSQIKKIEEPVIKADLVSPVPYLGALMQLASERHGIYQNTEYLESDRAILHYQMPLSVILVDFYDQLKSLSAGYASLNYELADYQETDVVKLEIIVAEEKVEALSTLVYRDEAYEVARRLTEKLKDKLPRQMFEVKIQAAIGGKVIASERIPAMRKDVLAKTSGGDYSRKAKLLKKQKAGKKQMKAVGHIEIPTTTYLEILKR